eukprot:4625775-Pleurochrysis_carterae.AAC.1
MRTGFGRRGARLLERKRHAIRQVRRHQMRNILLLTENDARLIDRNVNIQEIRYGPFILHIPSECKSPNEVVVQGVGSVMRVQCKEIVDIATQSHALFHVADRSSHCENAWV